MPTNETPERSRCLVYTRVMWYLSPVSRYNIWKKSEFYWRKYFSKKKALSQCDNVIKNNQEFIKQYS